MIQQFHFLIYIPKRIQSRIWKKYLYATFINDIIYSRHRWKQLRYPSTGEWMNKMGVYICEIILHCDKEADRCYNVDEPWELL